MTDVLTHGVHHVGLAVRDLDEATGFFCGTLGFKEVARNEAYPAVFVSDGSVTLTIIILVPYCLVSDKSEACLS